MQIAAKCIAQTDRQFVKMEKQNKPNKTTQRDFQKQIQMVSKRKLQNIDTKKREKRKKRQRKADGTNYLLFLLTPHTGQPTTDAISIQNDKTIK